ncbi:MAG: alpha/beta fold hydrolase [Pseudomonadota bacterium]|nr:alpha/beta fold hydrolase [Pseudomonadota bacterium]
MHKIIRKLATYLILLFSLSSCTISSDDLSRKGYTVNIENSNLNYRKWLSNEKAENLIIAIHGYNDYSNSFEIPANFLLKFNIEMVAFDLKGFGKNPNNGEWFNIDYHLNDLIKNIRKIKKENPEKNIYLLGESMGGAILFSLIAKNKNLPIKGVIFVAPAVWNFSKTNFLKSLPLKFFSKILPNLKVSGKGIIKVKASNNIEMLEKLAADKFFVHKPTLKSLQGVIDLMDESFLDSENYLQNPNYETLILIPLIDEIVPRKPLLSLLSDEHIKKNLGRKVKIGIYDGSYHMMLRDVQGNDITRELKEWIFNKKIVENFYSFRNIEKRLRNARFYHRLD